MIGLVSAGVEDQQTVGRPDPRLVDQLAYQAALAQLAQSTVRVITHRQVADTESPRPTKILYASAAASAISVIRSRLCRTDFTCSRLITSSPQDSTAKRIPSASRST